MSGQRVLSRAAALTAVCVVAAAASGCSSTSDLFGSSSGTSSGSGAPPTGNRISDLFFGSSTPPPAPGLAEAPSDVDCPGVDIRQGASTLTVNAGGRDPSANALRYQVTIVRAARECQLVGTTMRMKVGVQGRVILGPAGGPGHLDVPLRYAVVQEGPEPKTHMTKLFRIPVTIPPEQPNVTFTHVDEDITFSLPKPEALDAYVVYVGFDPLAPKAEPRRAPRRAR
jgi:hypothetical protein